MGAVTKIPALILAPATVKVVGLEGLPKVVLKAESVSEVVMVGVLLGGPLVTMRVPVPVKLVLAIVPFVPVAL